MPDCYIAGPNGAGKTTFAREFLPRFVQCYNFVNPDLIAAGLSPFDPSRAMTRAGRLVIWEIGDLIRKCETFAFETTLSGRTHVHTIDRLRERGYSIHMFYLWLPDVDLALSRIEDRVSLGGHNVPEVDVRRRYTRSLANLETLFRPKLDSLQVFDNSMMEPRSIYLDERGETTIFDHDLYALITKGQNR